VTGDEPGDGSRFDSATGRAAALARWAYEPDPAAATAPATAGFLARFEREVDPDNVLTPAERELRARRLMRAHMIQLSRRSRAKRT
jgi:hypothetical protein